MASGTIKAVLTKDNIVDNLTTNDSTKALSAAQGYALNAKISTFDLLFTGDVHALNDQITLTHALTDYRYLIFVGNVIPSRTPNYDVPSIPFPTALIKTGTAINIDMYSLRTSFAINFSTTTSATIANYSKESGQTYTPGIVKIYGSKV